VKLKVTTALASLQAAGRQREGHEKGKREKNELQDDGAYCGAFGTLKKQMR
jgi:hypothetical protein